MESLIYVIAGKEEALIGAKYRELIDELLKPGQKATALFTADNASVSITEILDELRTAPFLSDKRVVVVKQADDFISQNRELLEKYFDRPCPTGRLILTVKTWKSNTRLAKKLKKAGTLISLSPPNRRSLPQCLINYANDVYNKKLSREAADLLIEITGEELTRLYGEIDKLALLADNQKTITYQHIESLSGHNRIFNAFAVIDSVIDGDTGRAIEKLRGMFNEDKSAEYTVVGAFAYHLRRMFNAKAMLKKGIRQYDIIQQLRIWGNSDMFFAQLRKIPLNQIGKYIQYLGQADYEIKTGKTKAPVAIEQFVLKLSGAGVNN